MITLFAGFKSHLICVRFDEKKAIHFAPSSADSGTIDPRRYIRLRGRQKYY